MEWPEDKLAELRRLWAEGLTHTAISDVLAEKFGTRHSRQTVSIMAAELKLPYRRFLGTGDQGKRIAALREAGKTNPEIAAELGRSVDSVNHRIRSMIACGLLESRWNGDRRVRDNADDAERIAALRRAGQTNPEIADELGCSMRVVDYRVNSMIASGLVDRRGFGNRRRPV